MLNRCHRPPRSIASQRADRERQAARNRLLSNRLYNTAAWLTLRRLHLHEHPYCIDCGKRGNVVDHRIPHQGRSDLFFDPANLRTMCKQDHDRKTAIENNFGQSRAAELNNADSRLGRGLLIPTAAGSTPASASRTRGKPMT